MGPTGGAPGLKASGSAAGAAHRHQQAPAQVVGKQEAGPFAFPHIQATLFVTLFVTEKRRVESAALRETGFVLIYERLRAT